MRLISFSMTEPQFLDGSKDVTRRDGWRQLEAGQQLRAVRKAMGLKKGEKVETLGIIQVTNIRREPLSAILDEPEGSAREGFPELTEQQFVEMFCRHHSGCRPDTVITRIEFVHVENSMTDTATKATGRREAKTLDEQDHAPSPAPKSKGAARKRKTQTSKKKPAEKVEPEDPAGETLTAEQESAGTTESEQVEQVENTEAQPPASDDQTNDLIDSYIDEHLPSAQTQFEGEGFPGDLPEEVLKASRRFLGASRAHRALGKEKGKREISLIEVMQKHGIESVPMEGEDKCFTIARDPKVKIETMPKKRRQEAGLED